MADGIYLNDNPVCLDPGNEIEHSIAKRLRSFVWPSLAEILAANPFISHDHDLERFSSPFGDVPDPRLNEFVEPTGVSRYAKGMFLVDKVSAAAILGVSLSAMPTTISQSELTLRIEYDGVTMTRKVYPLEAIPVTETELWLIPVVDFRYIELNRSIELDAQTPSRTWTELFDEIETKTGFTIDTVNVPLPYQKPDERAFVDQAICAPLAIDAALMSLGQRAKVNDKVISIENAGSAETSLNAILTTLDSRRIKGEKGPKSNAIATLRLSGPEAVNYYDCEQWAVDKTGNGGSKVVSIRCNHYLHEINGATQAACQTSRDDLATQIAADALAWVAPSVFGIYSGPGENDSLSSMLDYATTHANGTSSITHSLVSLPADFAPKVQLSQWPENYVHLAAGSDWIFLPPSGGLPGRSGNTAGSALCTPVRINRTTGAITVVKNANNNPIPDLECWNLSTDTIPVGQYFTADTVGKMPVASPETTSSPAEAIPRIKFITNAAIADLVVSVTVKEVWGVAINPADGNPLAIGDTLSVIDLNNDWVFTEANAIGYAIYMPLVEDDPGTPGENESRDAFWQILTVEQPIDYVEGYIEACVEKTSPTGHTVHAKTNNVLAHLPEGGEDAYKLSSYPCVAIPSEWTKDEETPGGNFKYTIDAVNPFKKDAVSKSGSGTGSPHYKVKLRRVVKRGPADPTNEIFPKSDPTTGVVEWQIVDVEEQYARRIEGTIVGSDVGTVIRTRYIDGANPFVCDEVPTFVIACPVLCLGDERVCFTSYYDPEGNTYRIDKIEQKMKTLKVTTPDFVEQVDPYTGEESICLPVKEVTVCDVVDNNEFTCIPWGDCEDFNAT